MTRRVLTFFPHNPVPPRSGAHRRFLAVVGGLRELGCSVALVGSRLLSETRWGRDAVRELDALGIGPVRVHRPSPADYATAAAGVLPRRLLGRFPPVDSVAYAPRGLRRAFRRAVDEFDPDVLLINYAYWDRLVDHAADRHRLRVIDSYDLVSLQHAQRAALARFVPPRRRVEPARVPAAALGEDFFDRLGLRTDPRELAIYDRYDVTLAVTAAEADVIGRGAPRTRPLHLPITYDVPAVANSHDAPPVFVAGNNPFNVQGYCYLVRRALPAVLARTPGARVRVLGPVCDRLGAAPGAELAGFVPDLRAQYARARFAVCPVFGGTGQQVKIVEAMAHGLPVVALRPAADRSPIRYGENGLVAADAGQFADQF